jgi:hypothetical protein
LVLRDHHDLWVGDVRRFMGVGYFWFFGWCHYLIFACDLGYFSSGFLGDEKSIACIR